VKKMADLIGRIPGLLFCVRQTRRAGEDGPHRGERRRDHQKTPPPLLSIVQKTAHPWTSRRKIPREGRTSRGRSRETRGKGILDPVENSHNDGRLSTKTKASPNFNS